MGPSFFPLRTWNIDRLGEPSNHLTQDTRGPSWNGGEMTWEEFRPLMTL